MNITDFWVILNLLLTQSQQICEPAGLAQVILWSSFNGSSFRLLDHEQQQQHCNQPQRWSHLEEKKLCQMEMEVEQSLEWCEP